MKITFAGHSVISSSSKVQELVKEQIQKSITGVETVTFYLGGYGDFDNACACVCRKLKKERDGVELVYVTPYMGLSEQAKIKEMKGSGLYDDIIYPPIEDVPPRLAILKRNEWMMSNADLIIAYVNRSYGGAYKSLQVSRRKNKKVINICDFI